MSTNVESPQGMRFVVIDTESIGVHGSARLYEIGIVTIDGNGDVLDQYETLIRSPESDLHKRVARQLTGAPSFSDVAGDVLARMQAGVVAGHMTEHDLMMIQSELKRLGFGLPQVPYLCTNALATVLHFDSSSRRLAALAHTLGVEMESWHTARSDAAVTANVLVGLLNIAEERGILENLSRPSTFNGSWPTWPSFAISGHYLVRDPIAFPPIGDQPDDVTMTGRSSVVGTVTIDIASLIDPSKLAQLGIAIAKREVRDAHPEYKGWPTEARKLVPLLENSDLQLAAGAARRMSEIIPRPFDPTEEARDDFEKGRFRGESGIRRLNKIIDVFKNHDEPEVIEAQSKLAELLRYDPRHEHAEVVAVYEDAFDTALSIDDDQAETIYWDWQDYLIAHRDIDELCTLVMRIHKTPNIEPALFALPDLVHRLRTGGELEFATIAANKLSQTLDSIGAMSEAADVCAEWAQGLAEIDNPDEALEVADRAWSRGWSSLKLANRHSLILERQRDYAEAVAVCERGLAIEPDNEQLTKRLNRCRKKTT